MAGTIKMMVTGHPRNPWHIFLAVIGISAMGAYINALEPNAPYVIGGFLLLLAATSYLLFLALFNNVRRALLCCIAVSGTAALRAVGLKDIIYVYFLLLVLLLVDLYVRKISR